MEEDTEYKKLPIDERCVHKLWKARLNGYEEAIKIFREIDDEKSADWNKFVGLIKKFVTDAHAMCQERGLEATLIFIENCAHAGKIVSDVMSGIVSKCLAAPKTKTKELAAQVSLMFVEIDKQECVIEELIKGMEHKNPKIVAACVTTITNALKEFGNKVVLVKPLVKQIPVLLTDRDKTVRCEGKMLAIEIYRWIGDALKPQLTSLAAVVVSELEVEFEKMSKHKPEPTRFLKSQQKKKATVSLEATDGQVSDGEDDIKNAEIDPLDLIDPVDILSKMPKDFYEKLEDKKWQTRKESLDCIEILLQNPKLMAGDYHDLVKALKKVLAKDSNVVLVALAGKCIGALARGLNKKFLPYAPVCLSAILEKFKEKKANVVSALREAIDAIYVHWTLEAMQEDLLEALNSKNPSVKAETTQFLCRAFAQTAPSVFNKKLLKPLTLALLKTLNESDPLVRDGSAEALGILSKLLTEKVLNIYLADVDQLKMKKISEFAEKAVITVKYSTAPKKVRPATAPTKPETTGGGIGATATKESRPVAVRRPVSSANNTKKNTMKKSSSTSNVSGRGAPLPPQTFSERELQPEEVDARGADLLPANILSELEDANWKSRLSAVEAMQNLINDLEMAPDLSQVLIRLVCKKPGLKDTNFQVVKVKLEVVKKTIDMFGITNVTAEFVICDIIEKLGDSKNAVYAGITLSAMAEHISLDYVVMKMMTFAFTQKSPKIQSESLLWISNALKEFGLQVNTKVFLEDLRKAVQSTTPTVRQAAISTLGVLYIYMGDIMHYFESEKPALRQQIQTEFEKNAKLKPTTPTRWNINTKGQQDDGHGEKEDDFEEEQEEVVKEIQARIDISNQITESLLVEMSDKNWKTRNEGLVKLQVIISDAKRIQSSIGDLPQALGQRLVDSNAKIAQTALAICQQLAEAMGPPCKQYVRELFPGFLHGLGDGKQFIRTASITCMNIWGDQCGYKEFFDNEMLADAFKTGSPALRSELWLWLAEKLPTITPKTVPKDELLSCIPHLYTNISDRNADVRKNANDSIYGFMLHLGYECMVKSLERVKPSTKKDIQAALDKTRPNLPIKPLPKSKQQAPIIEEQKSVKTGNSKIQKAPSTTKVNVAVSRKKEEEIDTSPILAVNSLKNQRLLDEQKLKVLKWAFTSPRDEFTDLLKDQMTVANVNKSLMANMFHDDFRYHLKAIETLLEDLPANSKALICSLDLILKWVSLRFYDTNPSVLLKGLEYLNLVFEMLSVTGYVLAENEGSCFIPHLLIKIGDPKDSVRHGVRSLLRLICEIYPYTKVFVYIMDGLKSKNARQRTECLDELGYLIDRYGVNVCQPSPQVALKEIARHISDRDNSVRNAALNCVVQAYHLAGDKVYKLVGNLNEKDLSMLDERIKRAKKNKPAVDSSPKPNTSITSRPDDAAGAVMEEDEDEEIETEELSENNDSPSPGFSSPAVVVSPPKVKMVSGPFGVDPNIIDDIEKGWVRSDNMDQPQLLDVDLTFIRAPLNSAEINGIAYPTEKLQQLIRRPQQHGGVVLPAFGGGVQNFMKPKLSPPQANGSNLANDLPRLDPNLVRTIRSIASVDTIIARAALNEINDILEAPEKQAALRDYEELYVESICMQFMHLSQIPTSESLIMYQPVLSSTYTFFTSKTLGKNISVDPLKKMMSVLLGLMADQKLSHGDDGQYAKVINGICLRILDRTNFSHLNCALIRLLKETCSGAALPKFTDLLMKCIWRNVKVMPDKSQEMDYNAVLLEIHEFMVALPTAWWTQRPVDTPLRTVKTIIHNMTKLKGNDILHHLQGIPTQSELHTYLVRVLKNLQREISSSNTNLRTSPRNYGDVQRHSEVKPNSKQTHEAMSHIFKLIADKDTSNEGIVKLYEFKAQYPDIDLAPFLKGANAVFKKFIEDGLSDIEKSKRETIRSENCSPAIKLDPDFWMEKLNSIMHKSNFATTVQNENVNNKATAEHSANVQGKVPNRQFEPISTNRLELLQQKLSQIRQQKPT